MTQVFFNPPPEILGAASVHHGKCLICLMFAKGNQVQRTKEDWAPLHSDGNDREQKRIAYGEPIVINDADTIGVNDFFPGLLMPVCWTHLAAIAPPAPGPACNWCNGTGFKKKEQVQGVSAFTVPKNGKRGIG